MVAAWPLLLLGGLTVGSGEHAQEDARRCTDGSCKLEDELSLLQIKSDTVQRTELESNADAAPPNADSPTASPKLKKIMQSFFQGQVFGDAKQATQILVQWKLNMNNRKESKYLFFKNRWWPWFSELFENMPVVLHIGGTNLRETSVQLSNGQMSGSLEDLFAGDSLHINAGGETKPKPKMTMKEIHRCVNPGLVGDLVFLQNPNHEYCPSCPSFDKSGSSCTTMYNHTNITRYPHTAKFGNYRFVALNSGFTTELASRMFRAAVTGVMESGHENDILLGSWNVDPTDKPLHHIYGGYPEEMEGPGKGKIKKGTKSVQYSPTIVFPIGPDGNVMSPTCKACVGKPVSEQITDYAIAGPSVKMTALPSFADQTMYDTYTRLATSNVLSPPTVASSNFFPGQNTSDGVHVPLVYAIEYDIW
jgi:hypothetical protein